MIWTETADELLRVMVNTHTFAEIAPIVGTSRNACIGRARRLGLSKAKVVLSDAERMKRKHANYTRNNRQRAEKRKTDQIFIGCGVAQKVYAIKLPTVRQVDVEPRHIKLLDLEPNDCRYPYGDHEVTFCGHPQANGSSYCLKHFDLCWVEPKKRFGAKPKVTPKQKPSVRSLRVVGVWA